MSQNGSHLTILLSYDPEGLGYSALKTVKYCMGGHFCSHVQTQLECSSNQNKISSYPDEDQKKRSLPANSKLVLFSPGIS